MVTPTFAAGLGVVVAAVLAANMTKTVLHFSAPFKQCSVGHCVVQPTPHGGSLASARPGVPIAPVSPATSGPSTGDRPNVSASGRGAGHRRHQAAATAERVQIGYQVMQQWSGGFADQITIRGLSSAPGGNWRLAISYPGARIVSVQGAGWQPSGADSGVAQGASGQSSEGPGGPGGQGGNGSQDGAQLVVTVNGQPTQPSGCTFNGTPCSFTPSGSQ
jgi:hypothetical protein